MMFKTDWHSLLSQRLYPSLSRLCSSSIIMVKSQPSLFKQQQQQDKFLLAKVSGAMQAAEGECQSGPPVVISYK